MTAARYKQLGDSLHRDILSGCLSSGTRLPSNHILSGNLGVSSITVVSAYNRLIFRMSSHIPFLSH